MILVSLVMRDRHSRLLAKVEMDVLQNLRRIYCFAKRISRAVARSTGLADAG